MSRYGLLATALVGLAAGCSGDPEGPLTGVPTGPAQSSEVVFQAVDAGTGGALNDDQLTVRYLVRTPITLDASAVESVPSAEPYRVAHDVEGDSLVVEVRLEARSYHRVDTVFAVQRGGAAGPFTVRMTRRLERVAGGRTPTESGPTASPGPTGRTEETRPTDPDAGADRSPLQAGDRAFRAAQWFEAASAYGRMPAPTGLGDYARAYQGGMVNAGVSHINLAEMGAALDALETAVSVDIPNPRAYRYLGHVQCAVGRVDEGLDALDELEDAVDAIPAAERPAMLAFGRYEEALCRKRTFDRTEGTLNLVSAGRAATVALEGFIEQGSAVTPSTPEMTAALDDANRLLEEIRARMRRGGE